MIFKLGIGKDFNRAQNDSICFYIISRKYVSVAIFDRLFDISCYQFIS